MIPFNRPAVTGTELRNIEDSIRRGKASGDGYYGRTCESWFENHFGTRVLLTSSCTHALEMAAMLLDVKAGDSVVVPTFTFVSTANAFATRGADIVFADIREDTLNLDETKLATLMSERTRAVVPVHYGGIGCEMDVIGSICNRFGAAVVEDNAHGLFGRWKSKRLGTFGSLATLSFHETKNVSCGEGGALILNDCSLVERAEILREKGTDRSRFFRGMVDKYTWVDIGSSWVLSELQAAYLCGQLESAEAIQIERQRTWSAYQRDLESWSRRNCIRLPVVPVEAEHPAHLFTLILPDAEARGAFIEHMRARDVLTVFHYVPLHLSPMGRRYGGREGQCPIAEDLADRLVRLPLFYGMTGDEYARVVEAVLEFTP